MNRRFAFACAALTLVLGTSVVFATATSPLRAPPAASQITAAQIYWEYNRSDNELGLRVALDGEDWKSLKITRPEGHVMFDVKGKGPCKQLGLSQLCFGSARPSIAAFEIAVLFALFPEGTYTFEGHSLASGVAVATSDLSHAIPDGVQVFSQLGSGNYLQISWTQVAWPPAGFPKLPIQIAAYEVTLDSADTFRVRLPATATSVTVPPELVATLAHGVHAIEVIAIEQSGNRTIEEDTFLK